MKRALACAHGLLVVALALVGCSRAPTSSPSPDEAGPPWFEDVTGQTGIDFTHDAGPLDGKFFMPQNVGSGAAWFDFDGDGLLDLYLLHNGGSGGRKNQLFRQRSDGTFTDVSAGSGLDVAGFSMGAAVGDVNNDGFPDVLVSQVGGVRLFLNEGNGKFRDVTSEAGLINPLWGTSVSFLDYDRDGWLDLVVVNYLAYDPSTLCTNAEGQPDYCAPKSFKGTSSKLFRNLGNSPDPGPVRFLDVSFESGIGLKPGPGLGVVCADFDGDGWEDILVANDGAPNHLWINQKDGTFKDDAVHRGLALNAMGETEANMGIGWGDLDGDGLEDVFITHLNVETNTVWRQGPRGLFRDWTATSGLHRPHWRATGFGTVVADFDRDGALDVAIVNGDVVRRRRSQPSPLGPHWGPYAQHNQLFVNDGRGRFRDVSRTTPALCGYENVGRGLAVGIVRNDGVPWLVTVAIGDRSRVLRAVVPSRKEEAHGNWLVIRAFDPALKRDALGARVTVRAGDRVWVRTAHTGGSFLCSNDPRPHFGLGPTSVIDTIEMAWPDGSRERFAGGPVNRVVTLNRGTGKPIREGSP